MRGKGGEGKGGEKEEEEKEEDEGGYLNFDDCVFNFVIVNKLLDLEGRNFSDGLKIQCHKRLSRKGGQRYKQPRTREDGWDEQTERRNETRRGKEKEIRKMSTQEQ